MLQELADLLLAILHAVAAVESQIVAEEAVTAVTTEEPQVEEATRRSRRHCCSVPAVAAMASSGSHGVQAGCH